MTRQIDAIYEKGALHPVEPLPLAEHQRVTLIVSEIVPAKERSHLDLDYIERAKREVAKMSRIPTLQEVQQRLSKISGTMAQDVVAEREDR